MSQTLILSKNDGGKISLNIDLAQTRRGTKQNLLEKPAVRTFLLLSTFHQQTNIYKTTVLPS